MIYYYISKFIHLYFFLKKSAYIPIALCGKNKKCDTKKYIIFPMRNKNKLYN